MSRSAHLRGLAEQVMERREHFARRYRDHGGSAELMGEVERFVTRRHDALNSCQTVLCHNDFINGSLLARPPVTRSSPVSSTFNAHPSTIPWLTSPKRFATPHSIGQAAPGG